MSVFQRRKSILTNIQEKGKRAIRRIGENIGISKSAAGRQMVSQKERLQYPESPLWETAEGFNFIIRLYVVTLYTFGMKRGVGMESISEFFYRIHLPHFGCSPSALRDSRAKLEKELLAIGQRWEALGIENAEDLEIIGSPDETFFEEMILVLMDLKSGYILLEEAAEQRSFESWKERIEKRLKGWSLRVVYLVSDRAKALIKLGPQWLGCRSIPDLFHATHELAKGYSLSIQWRLKQATQRFEKATQALSQLQAKGPDRREVEWRWQVKEVQEAKQQVEHWATASAIYREEMRQFSLVVHPFHLLESRPQSFSEVYHQLNGVLERMEKMDLEYQLHREEYLKRVKNQISDIAELPRVWWIWVEASLESYCLDTITQSWLKETLLPLLYWQEQIQKTQSADRRLCYQQAFEKAQQQWQMHPLSAKIDQQTLEKWKQWGLEKVIGFQRTSSAVEGRNGYLTQMNYNRRGLNQQRLKVMSIIHNFDIYDQERTTPAQRLFRREFPDLLETLLGEIQDLPLSRSRKNVHPRNARKLQPVPV